jgi:hypothetical protein
VTNPVLNQNSPLVDIKTGKIIPPWNSFFQQTTQKAPKVIAVTVSPFTPNANGTVILTSATTITLTRGLVNISLTGQRIIPMGIGDTVAWTGPATVQFLGA